MYSSIPGNNLSCDICRTILLTICRSPSCARLMAKSTLISLNKTCTASHDVILNASWPGSANHILHDTNVSFVFLPQYKTKCYVGRKRIYLPSKHNLSHCSCGSRDEGGELSPLHVIWVFIICTYRKQLRRHHA